MNQSDTPETDRAELEVKIGMASRYDTVPANFARRLERERDAAYDAIRQASKEFDAVPWGHNGDCGAGNIISRLEDILPENR